MIFIFSTFAANIESEKGISITPSLFGFASLDVDDQGHLFSKYINPDIIEVKNYSYNYSIERIKSGQTTGFVFVPEDSIDKIRNIGTINIKLYLDVSDPKRSVIKDEVTSTTKLMGDTISSSWVDSLAPQNVTQTFNQQNTGESLPLQIITKAMIAILLFLPLFLFGNMMIDSIVGEKERKTGEILMAMPLSTTEIIIGKSMAVIGIIAIQVALWMSILLLTGFQITNPLNIYLLVFITAIPVIGITVVIAAYSKNYKEAGIGLTFGYVASVGILMIPALVYLSNKSISSNISPLTMVIRILSGENIPLWQFLIPICFVALMSVITYWISIKLYERDDVVFGPRPGLIRLSLELIGIKKT
jgi:ABC-2 type transport system permease protein